MTHEIDNALLLHGEQDEMPTPAIRAILTDAVCLGELMRENEAWQGKARQGAARRGWARQARQARKGVTWFDVAVMDWHGRPTRECALLLGLSGNQYPQMAAGLR